MRPIAAIYCSDLTRDLDIARAIAACLPSPPELRARADLRGIDLFGSAGVGHAPVQLRAVVGEHFYRTGTWDALAETESVPAFRQRLIQAVTEISDMHPSELVALVGHGGVISTLLAALCSRSTTERAYPGYSTITRLIRGEAGWTAS